MNKEACAAAVFLRECCKAGRRSGLFIDAFLLKGSLTAGVGDEGTPPSFNDGGGGEKFQSAPRVYTSFVTHGLLITAHVL